MCNHIQAVRLWIRNRRRYIGLVVLFFPLECGAARRPAPPSTLDVASRRAGERDVEEELEQLALEGSAER